MMFWRFLPPYVTDPKKFRLDTINARGETLLDSNVWRYAFLHSRCLVPIDSFVEWRRVDPKTKLPWLFGMKDGEPFALAGVYRHWRSPDGKSGMDTFAIITTNRMNSSSKRPDMTACPSSSDDMDVLQLSGLLAGDVKKSQNRNSTTIFKWRQTEPGLILCAVRWYLRYSLSLRDVEELLEERGLHVDHTTVWRWVQYYGPELEQRLRRHLKPTNKSWRVDETDVRVKGRWCYLYRAIDSRVQPSISCCQHSATPTLPSSCFARRSVIDPIANLE